MKKQLMGLCLFLVLAVGLILPAVTATTTFTMNVKVNGDSIDKTTVLSAERGDKLDLRVSVSADTDTKDVRLRAWIGGYEYDILEDKTDMFDLETNVTKVKTMKISLPKDMEADKKYTLHVEVVNGNVDFDAPLNIKVDKARHQLSVQDVIISPSTSLNAGDDVWAKVRLENTGDKKQEDIKIVVSIPSLNLVAPAVYIDELVTTEDWSVLLGGSSITFDDDDETSESSEFVKLTLPADVKTGMYEMLVTVTYNRGHSTVTSKKLLSVTATTPVKEDKPAEKPKVQPVVLLDKTYATVEQGSEAVYTVTFANLGDKSRLYSVSVSGAQLWANVRTSPSFVSVGASQTGEVKVYVKALDNAQAGNKQLVLQVKEDNKLIAQQVVGAKVTAKAKSASSTLLSSSTLKLGFVGLVVLVVIIGLIVAFRKLREDDDYPLEPKDGQTYY